MPYQLISSNYFLSDWYQYGIVPTSTGKTSNERYTTLGTFSQKTNWEKVFSLGNQINIDLQMSEQDIINDVANYRKRKNS